MTTEEREAAADAVARYSAKLNENKPDQLLDATGLRWWREPLGEAVRANG